MNSDLYERLGVALTGADAHSLAASLGSGEHIATALLAIPTNRRPEVKELLADVGLDHHDPDRAVAVLASIAGAKTIRTPITPVWTLPDGAAAGGHLHSEFPKIVAQARQSVTAATYNFQETSEMREILHRLSSEENVAVTIYVDGEVGNAEEIKAWIPKASVYKSVTSFEGKTLRSHAKFIVIDHTIVLATSANFSWAAANANVEFGLKIEFPTLAKDLESTMAARHGSIYQQV